MFISTAQKIAWREIKATPSKFLFVILAVAVGVGALSGVKGFSSAFRSMLLRNAKQLVAADLQAQIWSLPSPEQLSRIERLQQSNIQTTRVTETVSMAAAQGQQVPQMVTIKAFDPAAYPYYGELSTEPERPLQELLANDQVLVTPEVLLRLHAEVGKTLRLGGRDFLIAGTITAEPDRLASGFGPSMRVLMSRSSLDATGLIQFGSRAAQRFLFKLGPEVNLDKMKDRLRSILPKPFFTDYRDGDVSVERGISNAERFLSLVSLIALIVGALGVAMAMYSHLQQRMDTIAIMKAVGARSGQIMQIYVIQTIRLGLVGGVLGSLLGGIVQRSFPLLIQRVFAMLPEVTWDWSFAFQGLALGVLATVLFTVPPLLSIGDVRPSLVFRREMDDGKTATGRGYRRNLASALAIVVVLAGFALMAVWLSNSWQMGAYFFAALLLSLFILSGIAIFVLWCLKYLVARFRNVLPTSFRHGLANLYRPGNQARAVLVALGLGVMFTTTTYLLQQTILREIKSEGPGMTGNLFLLDVRHTQRDELSQLVKEQSGVKGNLRLVGYLVSRLISKNNIPTEQLRLPRERKDRLQTARLMVADSKPSEIQIQKGQWWSDESSDPQIAISEDESLHYDLGLGDRLQFQAAGRTVTAPVVAIFRRSSRSTIRFDLLLPRKSLAGLPLVYFGAVHVEPKFIPALEVKLFERYPTVTVMNVAEVLQRVQEAVDQIAVAIRFLALFAVVAGIIILSSSVAGTRYRRIREVAILKTIGATSSRINTIFSIEFSVLGAIAGLLGSLLANVFTAILARRFLETNFDFDWKTLLWTMLATALLANLAGWAASLRVLNQRPLEVLRGE